MTGPMTRDTFICTELSEIAPPRSSRGTRTGTTRAEDRRVRARCRCRWQHDQPPARLVRVVAEATKASRSENRRLLEGEDDEQLLAVEGVGDMPPTTENSSSGPSWATMMTPTKTAEPVRS